MYKCLRYTMSRLRILSRAWHLNNIIFSYYKEFVFVFVRHPGSLKRAFKQDLRQFL